MSEQRPLGLEGLPADEALAVIEGFPRTEWPTLVGVWARGDGAAAAELLELLAQGEDLSSSPAQREGQVLAGRYQLLVQVGKGVTGTVWKSRDTKLKRDVALKIFDAAPDRVLLARALQEARMTADVVSEHVLRIYDVVEPDAEGPAFIVMELIQEFDAAKRSQVGIELAKAVPKSLNEALRWAADAASGLAAAHTRGVFQRDVKLQNMLLTPVSRRVKVLDFGLATHQLNDTPQTAHEQGSVTVLLNDGATIAGTPSCMAPEAARGLVADASSEEGRRILAAVDVFGVGAALYELLSGRRLYEPPWHGGTGLAEVLRLAVAGPKFPLPALQARFRVPGQVQRLLERALSPNVETRYQSVVALADDLEAILSSQPTSLDRHHYALRARLWNRRLQHLPLSVMTGALILVTAASAAAALSSELTQTAAELGSRRADLAKAAGELNEFRTQLERVRSLATTAEKAAISAEQDKEKAQARSRKSDEARAEAERERDGARAAQKTAETERDEARMAQKAAEKERDESRSARRQAEREREEAKAQKRQAERAREEALSALRQAQAQAEDAGPPSLTPERGEGQGEGAATTKLEGDFRH